MDSGALGQQDRLDYLQRVRNLARQYNHRCPREFERRDQNLDPNNIIGGKKKENELESKTRMSNKNKSVKKIERQKETNSKNTAKSNKLSNIYFIYPKYIFTNMPLTARQWKESEDILEGWTIPTRRTAEERRIYGPRPENLQQQLELLNELEQKLKKHPEIATQLKADLAEQEAAHPDKSRFQIRLELLRHYLTNSKKLRMKGKFQRAHFIGLYEIFKGRKMVDNIFKMIYYKKP